MVKVKFSNLFSIRGLLAVSLLFTFSPEHLWWQQVILILTVSYLVGTSLLGKKN